MVPRPDLQLSEPAPLRVAFTLEQCWHRVPGGTARAALDLATALTERATVGEGERRRPLELVGVAAWHRHRPDPAFEPTIPVRHLRIGRRLLYESWHRLGRPGVESATGPVDVVHATGLAMPPRRVPLVWTLHDLAFLREPGHFSAHGLRFFHAALDLALDHADVVVCSSVATREDALGAGFEPGRLRVVPLGASSVRATPDDVTRVKAALGLSNPYVLHVGTAEPRKNVEGLVDALQRLDRRDVDLVLVGPQGWGPSLEGALARLGPRVRRLGFVAEADRNALYAGAAVFCYPSLWEGFGLPVLEALVQGAPTVTSAGTATEEVAGDAALLVDPRDPDAIAGALASVLDDADVAARLSAAGPVRAASFTWDRTARETAAIYFDLAVGS